MPIYYNGALVGMNNAVHDKDYQAKLSEKTTQILGDKTSISVNELKKNSLFNDAYKKLDAEGKKQFDAILNLDGDANQVSEKELKTLIGRAEVVYEAILGKTLINVHEFLELKQGDILRLDREADDKAIVSIDKKDVFLAQIGLHRFRKSIKILELIRTDKDEIKEILEKYEEERKAKASVYDEPEEEDEEI